MSDKPSDRSSSSDKISEEELSLINDTFSIIKNLNKDLEEVHKSKKTLEKSISTAKERIGHGKTQEIDVEKVLKTLKGQILNDLKPQIEKVSSSNISDNLIKDIKNLVEKENANLKTEVSRLNKVVSLSFDKKKFDDIEKKLEDFSQSNENLKKKISSDISNKKDILFSDIEKDIQTILDKKNKKLLSIINNESSEIQSLKAIVNENTKDVDSFRRAVKEILGKGVENPLMKKEFDSLRKSLRKNEKDISEKLLEYEKLNEAQETFITDKLNAVIDTVNKNTNLSSDKILSTEKSIEKRLDSHIDRKIKKIVESQKKVITDLQKDLDNVNKKYMNKDKVLGARLTQINKHIEDDSVDMSSNQSRIHKAEKEIGGIRSYVEKLEDDIHTKNHESMIKVEKKFSKDMEKIFVKMESLSNLRAEQEKFVIDKINYITKLFNSLVEKNDSKINKSLNKFLQESNAAMDKKISLVEDLSKGVVEVKDNLKKIKVDYDKKFDGQEVFIVNKINSIIESFEGFEKKNIAAIKDLEIRLEGKIDKGIESKVENINLLRDKLISHIEKKSEPLKESKNLIKDRIDSELKKVEARLSNKILSNEDLMKKISSDNKDINKSIERGLDDAKKLFDEVSKSYFNEIDNLIKDRYGKYEDYVKDISTRVDNLDSKAISSIEERLILLEGSEEEIRKIIGSAEDDMLEKIDSRLLEFEDKIMEAVTSIETRLEDSQVRNSEEREKLRDEIFEDAKKVISQEFDVKGGDILSMVNDRLVELEKIKDAHEDFIVEKINSVIDDVSTFEKKREEVFDEMKIGLDDYVKKEVMKDYSLTSQKFFEDVEEAKTRVEEVEKAYLENSQEVKYLKEDGEKLKKSIDQLNDANIKAIESVEKQIEIIGDEIHKKDNNIPQIKDLDKTIEKKVNEGVKGVSKLFEEKLLFLNNVKKEAKDVFNMEAKELEAKYAKSLVMVKDFISKSDLQNKSLNKTLSEKIDEKIVSVEKGYEDSFKKSIEKFDKELKEKEKKYINKLLNVEKDKVETLNAMELYKHEFDKISKDYFSKIEERIESSKIAKANYDKDKKEFELHIDNLINKKKDDISGFIDSIEEKVESMIINHNEKQNMESETFREIFSDKVSALHEFTDKKLREVESKFIDKNYDLFLDKIGKEVDTLRILEDKIDSKLNTLEERDNIFEIKAEEFLKSITIDEAKIEDTINEKVKEMDLFVNRKLLDIDSDFSNFKSVVVDELESYGEVPTSYNIDTLRSEVKELREEVKGLRVFGAGSRDINGVVANMIEYEKSLMSLVDSLRRRKVDNRTIKRALINKGHPKIYVSMIVDNYDQILK